MKTFSTLASFLLVALPIRAATLHVDGTTCSLADAIVAANTDTPTGGCPQGDSGADTLVLDADLTLSAADPTSTLHGGVRAGLPDITDDLTIAAGLGSVIRRDPTFTCEAATADPVFRFLQLESGSLTLRGLVFENGCFVGSAPDNEGGGLRAAASTELTLDGVVVSAHGAFSTSGSLQGGFLYTEGDRLSLIGGSFDGVIAGAASSLQGGVLHIDDPVIATLQGTDFSHLGSSSASTVQGGALYSRGQLVVDGSTFEEVDWISSSGGLQGGAIYSSSGSLVVRHSSFRLFTGTTQSGSTTQGGAIYASNDGLALTDTVFSDFDLFSSGGCSGGVLFSLEDGPHERLIFERLRCQTDSSIEGTAARFLSSNTILRDCLFRDNEGRTAQPGFGGAVNATRFELLERCAFVGNRLQPALSFVNPEVRGGAVVAGQIGVLRNVTFAGNVIQAGSGVGVDAASAFGGGLYLSNTTSTSRISSATFVANQAIGGDASAGFVDGQGFGGGLYISTGHTAEVVGSILSGSTVTDGGGSTAGQDCFTDGGFTSLGYNVAQNPGDGCDFTSFGDITGTDPNLYPVADYGCATTLPGGTCVPAAAIDQTSWAVDWSSCADLGIGDDSRGLQRRQDIPGVPNLTADACDSGAFEAQDRDGDGVTDVPDLCPDDADPDQSDGDGDQVGDACDACEGDDASGDTDGDLVCDDSDVCAGSDDGADTDADNVPDGCDVCRGDDASGDSDGDLVCDDSDVCAGSDDGADA
ncbi:MAG: hypothetical protein MI919_35560, partial [Holophagales bacterium]|nr:hypothetical protein [Holophagales bacterium]